MDDAEVLMWVDAICINQHDKEEKTAQIARMWEIYRNATRVCIWLGEGKKSSYDAMRFITEIVDSESDDIFRDKGRIPRWRDLADLMRNDWFSRRWVVQEVALAKEASVHYGQEAVHWDDFRDAISLVTIHSDTIQGLFETVEDLDILSAKALVDLTSNIFRNNKIFEPTLGLEYLVSALYAFKCSDPRDTIFALRNIACETSRLNSENQPPEPDYKKGLLEVYRDFVRWAIQTSKSLDIVCRHWALPEQMKGENNSTSSEKLPSWIQVMEGPGGNNGVSFVGLPGRSSYNASYKKAPEFRWSDHSSVQSSYPPPAKSRSNSDNPNDSATVNPNDTTVNPDDLAMANAMANPDGGATADPTAKPGDHAAANSDDHSAANPDDHAAANPYDRAAANPNDTTVNLEDYAMANPDGGSTANPNDHAAANPDDGATANPNHTTVHPDDHVAANPNNTTANPDDHAAANPDGHAAANPDDYSTANLVDGATANLDGHTTTDPNNHTTANLPGSWPGDLPAQSEPNDAQPVGQPLPPAHASKPDPQLDPRDSETAESVTRPPRPHLDLSLCVKGLIIGQITWTSNPITKDVIPQSCLEKAGWAQLEQPNSVPDKLWRTLVADRGPDGGLPPRWYHRACLYCLINNIHGDIDTNELLKTPTKFVKEYLKRVQAVIRNRKFLEAKEEGLFGLCSSKAEPNDIVCILFGCSVPVVLRVRDKKDGGGYLFVEEAYIYGKMDGEAITALTKEELAKKTMEFRLI
jgi:hypothetical protein